MHLTMKAGQMMLAPGVASSTPAGGAASSSSASAHDPPKMVAVFDRFLDGALRKYSRLSRTLGSKEVGEQVSN